MSAKQERHALTDFQKGQIVALRPYFSHHKIGSQLGIPPRTVSGFSERLDNRQSIEDLPRPGRPRKTSAGYIIRSAESETRVPLAELCLDTGINICEQTIRRRLRKSLILVGQSFE